MCSEEYIESNQSEIDLPMSEYDVCNKIQNELLFFFVKLELEQGPNFKKKGYFGIEKIGDIKIVKCKDFCFKINEKVKNYEKLVMILNAKLNFQYNITWVMNYEEECIYIGMCKDVTDYDFGKLSLPKTENKMNEGFVSEFNNDKFNNDKFNNDKFNNDKFNNDKFNNDKFNNSEFNHGSTYNELDGQKDRYDKLSALFENNFFENKLYEKDLVQDEFYENNVPDHAYKNYFNACYDNRSEFYEREFYERNEKKLYETDEYYFSPNIIHLDEFYDYKML